MATASLRSEIPDPRRQRIARSGKRKMGTLFHPFSHSLPLVSFVPFLHAVLSTSPLARPLSRAPLAFAPFRPHLLPCSPLHASPTRCPLCGVTPQLRPHARFGACARRGSLSACVCVWVFVFHRVGAVQESPPSRCPAVPQSRFLPVATFFPPTPTFRPALPPPSPLHVRNGLAVSCTGVGIGMVCVRACPCVLL